ncbi:MAG: hypothetical protein ACO3UM_07420, partial [Planctomycetota bacterium]
MSDILEHAVPEGCDTAPCGSEQLTPQTFDRALTAFRVLFFQLDEEGRVLEWSERAGAVLGPVRDQVLGRPLEALPIGWDVERVFTLAVAALERDGEPVLDLVPVECADGTQAVLEFSATAVAGQESVLLVGEDSRTGSLLESIACRLGESLFDRLDAPIRVLGALDAPVPYAP